ncbi:type II secretion system protein [Verrucomicrobium spinosum]|nr:type II secretion system protein [Verrucomicrobium spinosum]
MNSRQAAMLSCFRDRQLRAFTLVELLIVVSVMGSCWPWRVRGPAVS